MSDANGNGNDNGKQLDNWDATQFTDSNGDVWTVAPSDDAPGEVAVWVDTEIDPVEVSIPAADVGQLVARLMSVRWQAWRRAEKAREANVSLASARPACDGTCGDCDSDSGEHSAHIGEAG